MRFRDFIEVDNHLFSVLKGGDKIICVLRYVPNGDRVRGKNTYRKIKHSEAYRYLREFYNDGLHYIPLERVEKHYDAMKLLPEICERDECVKKVANFFNLEKMGVTGSRLIGLSKEDSDVDFVLYDECFNVGREKIRKGLEKGDLESPDLEKVYEKRNVALPYEIFVVHERRKYNKAIIDGVSFDILYAGRDANIVKGEKVGKVEVRGKVIQARPFEYPAVYKLPDCDILCYTHTFVGQAFEGEFIEARGILEIINGRKVVIIGSRRDIEDEYVVSLTLLEREGMIDDFEMWKRI
ncbi:nucleotidyltransferase domain-containing protein [Archaeoglobus profundus]|uniref:DNA polymerase beta domain protein region n=1 Tax=Archaeoglobus profundus (strain DSM 5631 / JCM 9629 / NBRC 100127 / Av18) TaxID=572546 RepID=D2RHI2_ARCPA|nr:nucleotidyltransferase domain-containing protein [Archaeoglobus profundus]ADB57757.1 DNA polymerase beta domain protein region [Archaeoglobus profundus DSM 5631]